MSFSFEGWQHHRTGARSTAVDRLIVSSTGPRRPPRPGSRESGVPVTGGLRSPNHDGCVDSGSFRFITPCVYGVYITEDACVSVTLLPSVRK